MKKLIFLCAISIVVLSFLSGCSPLYTYRENPLAFSEHLQESKPLQKLALDAALKDPNNPASWVECGRACLFSNSPGVAEIAFKKSLQLDPKYLPAYKHLGLALTTLHRYPEAEKNYGDALKIYEDSELWTAYGYCLVNLGNDNEALEAFQNSIRLNNNSVAVISARLGASALLKRRGDIVGAQREYEEALKTEPEIVKILGEQKNLSTATSQPEEKGSREADAEAWYNKGAALGELGRWQEALTCYERALEINPAYARSWYNIGRGLGELGRWQEALTCYERALEINPALADAWCNKGVALWKLGRYQKAVASFERAVEINPADADAWYNKGVTLYQLKRNLEAAKAFEEAERLGDQDARRALEVLKKEGR